MSSSARRLISSGSTFEAQIGYCVPSSTATGCSCRALRATHSTHMSISDDVAEQTAQALHNIGAALTEAGASFADVVRVHYLLPDANDFEACWPALREVFGEIRPAATMLQAGLSSDAMRIEIEVTARIRGRPRQ